MVAISKIESNKYKRNNIRIENFIYSHTPKWITKLPTFLQRIVAKFFIKLEIYSIEKWTKTVFDFYKAKQLVWRLVIHN